MFDVRIRQEGVWPPRDTESADGESTGSFLASAMGLRRSTSLSAAVRAQRTLLSLPFALFMSAFSFCFPLKQRATVSEPSSFLDYYKTKHQEEIAQRMARVEARHQRATVCAFLFVFRLHVVPCLLLFRYMCLARSVGCFCLLMVVAQCLLFLFFLFE